MKLKARLFVDELENKKYFQTVAVKGKEVIPFIYLGDIIYLGTGSDDPTHEENWKKVQDCLNSKHYIYYPNGQRHGDMGYSMAHYNIEQALESMGYEQDQSFVKEGDLRMGYPLILSWTQIEMLRMQHGIHEFGKKLSVE